MSKTKIKKIKKGGAGKIIKGSMVAGALATGAYMLLGPDGKKNQKKLKDFAGKVKKEVMKDAKMVMKDTKKIIKEAKVASKDIKKDVKTAGKKIKKTIAKSVEKAKSIKK